MSGLPSTARNLGIGAMPMPAAAIEIWLLMPPTRWMFSRGMPLETSWRYMESMLDERWPFMTTRRPASSETSMLARLDKGSPVLTPTQKKRSFTSGVVRSWGRSSASCRSTMATSSSPEATALARSAHSSTDMVSSTSPYAAEKPENSRLKAVMEPW